MNNILEKILLLREERGWSEYRLAEESGVAQSSISSWYRRGMYPTFSSLEKIVDAFGMSMSQFFAEEKEAFPLSEEQRTLIDKWAALNREQREALLGLILTMKP